MIEYIPSLPRRGSSRLTFSENGLEERVFINQDTVTDWIRDWKRIPGGHAYFSERPWAGELIYRELDLAGNLLQEYLHVKPEFERISRGDLFTLEDGGYLYAYRYFDGFHAQETVFGRRGGDGELLWERDDNVPNDGEGFNGVERIVMTTAGTVVMSEFMDDFGTPGAITDFNGNFVLRGFTADTGEELWYHVFQPQNLYVSQLIPAANGDVIGVGWRAVEELDGIGDEGYIIGWLFRATSEGEIRWQRNLTTVSAAFFENRLQDVIELPDGRIAAVGYSANGTLPNGLVNVDVWLVVVDEDGCVEPGCGEDVIVATREPVPASPLNIWPNPAEHELQLYLPDHGLSRIDLYNLQGHLLLSTSARGPTRLPVGNMPRGVVVVRVRDDEGKSSVGTVILH